MPKQRMLTMKGAAFLPVAAALLLATRAAQQGALQQSVPEPPFVSEVRIVQNGEVFYHAIWEDVCTDRSADMQCLRPRIFGRLLQVREIRELLPNQAGEIQLKIRRGVNPPDSTPDVSELAVVPHPVDAFVRVGPARVRGEWIVAHVGAFNKSGRMHFSIGPTDSASLSRTQRAVAFGESVQALDAFPSTIPRADTTDAGLIHWRRYERGVDFHHAIRVEVADPQPKDTIPARAAEASGPELPEPPEPKLPPASDGVCGPAGKWSGTLTGAAAGNWSGDFAVWVGDYPGSFALTGLQRTNPSVPMPKKVQWRMLWSVWGGSGPKSASIMVGQPPALEVAAILADAVAPGDLLVRVTDSTPKTMSGTLSVGTRLMPKTQDEMMEVARSGSMADRPAVHLQATFCAVRVSGVPTSPSGSQPAGTPPAKKERCADLRQIANEAEGRLQSRQEHLRSLKPQLDELHRKLADLDAAIADQVPRVFDELIFVEAAAQLVNLVEDYLVEIAVSRGAGLGIEGAKQTIAWYQSGMDFKDLFETYERAKTLGPDANPEKMLQDAQKKEYAETARLAHLLIDSHNLHGELGASLLQFISVFEGRTTTVAQGKSFERLIRERDEAQARLEACLAQS